jgi:hypothetical protein
MAEQSLYDQGLSHDELKYREHFQRGIDFTKIELYMSAREEFRAALTYKPGDKASEEKAAECENHITKDAKAVYIIVPIVLAIIVAIAIFA